MKKTILSRLFISFLILGAFIFILLNTFGYNHLNKKISENKVDFLYKESNLIASEYMSNYYDNSLTPSELESQLRAIETFIDVRVWIVNTEGLVAVDSSRVNSAKSVNLNDFDAGFLELSFTENNRFPHFFSEPVMSVIQPVSHEYRVRGYIILHTPLSTITNETHLYLNIINISFLIFMFLLTLCFAYIYYITAWPMKKLIKAAQEYSSGNYNYNLDRKGLIEYIELSDSISYMAGELRNLDNYQKNFVANVSHDFRSPLTSIKGYAEAILDGTIPHESQDKYLDIILFETERLNKLTSRLLELNKFEGRGRILDIISFDINTMIKAIAESFEGACSQRRISFSLLFAEKEIYVDADMDQIQQVLYNLIDNAIKFSNNDSNIQISSKIKGDKVFISVKDYGLGIAKESQHKVWDRFYKTDSSRGKDKIGTGLGLSISKEIIQAHNENLSLVSTDSVGSEFIFSLHRTE